MTDESGKILNRYEYDAFGNFTVKEEKVENRFCFTGEQYDPASNLYYLRARFYSPVIGRFLNEDTYYGDGLNLYAYCHNNPVGYVDPSGHVCEEKYNAVESLREQDDSNAADALKKYKELREQGYTPEQIKNGDYKTSHGKSSGSSAYQSGSKTGRNAGEYHTFYEYELDIKDYMKSDSVQFRKANKALIEKMNSDSNFKKQILSAHPEMKQWLDNPNLSNSPTGKGGRDIWGGGKAGRQGKIK